MTRYPHRTKPLPDSDLPSSIKYGQNFYHNFKLAFTLVKNTNIEQHDEVLEIGPGEGIFTKTLVQQAKSVTAVELDAELFSKLERKFAGTPNLQLVHEDFLAFPLPTTPYKVFSNLPFNISAAVLRKLLYAPNSPQTAYFILQAEAAQKLTGRDTNNQSAILFQPWFSFRTIRQLARTDFHPVPAVNCVFLEIIKLSEPLLDKKLRLGYEDFVKFGFNRWRVNLHQNFKKIFTYPQWEKLAIDLGFNRKALPSALTVEQWIGLYKFYVNSHQS